jgi:maleate cis-trans isomerase
VAEQAGDRRALAQAHNIMASCTAAPARQAIQNLQRSLNQRSGDPVAQAAASTTWPWSPSTDNWS